MTPRKNAQLLSKHHNSVIQREPSWSPNADGSPKTQTWPSPLTLIQEHWGWGAPVLCQPFVCVSLCPPPQIGRSRKREAAAVSTVSPCMYIPSDGMGNSPPRTQLLPRGNYCFTHVLSSVPVLLIGRSVRWLQPALQPPQPPTRCKGKLTRGLCPFLLLYPLAGKPGLNSFLLAIYMRNSAFF